MAKHFRDVHLGGNWTSVKLRSTLANVNRQQATTQVQSSNTIAVLVFHMIYYLSAVTRVLQGGPLDASNKYSFALPPVGLQGKIKKWIAGGEGHA